MGNCLFRSNADEEGDEGVKDLVDMTIKKMDHDRDGRISFSDYSITVAEDYLMMEAFGTCLPTNKKGEIFKQNILD